MSEKMAEGPGTGPNKRGLRGNLHTHTHRCGHATGEVIDYCNHAQLEGLEYLGISDHTPLPDGRWPNVRMHMNELEAYCAAIKEAQIKSPGLTVIKGMECEYFPEYHDFFVEHLIRHAGCDFLIGAVHYVPFQGNLISVFGDITTAATLRAYTKQCIATMESGLFTCIAHPDVFANCYPEWDEVVEECAREIFRTAVEVNLPLEINTYGYYKPPVETTLGTRSAYPWKPFWELAREYALEVVINSDAHMPNLVLGRMAEGLALARRLGLNVVEPLTNKSI